MAVKARFDQGWRGKVRHVKAVEVCKVAIRTVCFGKVGRFCYGKL